MNDTLPMNERYSAHLSRYFETYKKSLENPDEFWNEHASIIDWFSPYTKVLDDSKKPFYRWFINGKTNMSYNCLDRYANNEKRNKVAFIWVPEKGEEKVVTYYGLYRRVNAFAKALLNLGIKKGDGVTIYLPMILEAPIAMLACTRIWS